MPTIAVFVFLGSVLFITYVLLGYPLLLAALAVWGRPAIKKDSGTRTVSFIIPVHNGQDWIQSKLASITQLNYPPGLLQILLIDDGSVDHTADVIKQYADARVEVISIPRSGKAAALNAGIARATGEILLFTDIRQRLDPGSVRALVECFADPSVGVASGELVILSGETQAEANIGLYWMYEKWMRKRLSQLDSVLGATGCLYAMRRDLAVPLPPDTLLDDVYLPLAAFFKGYRVIFETRAKAFDYPTALKSEFRRKVRTQAGVYQIVGAYPRLLLPTTRMWLHFVSHKLGRLLLPYALILVAVSSIALPRGWNMMALAGQAGLYGLAGLDGWIPRPFRRISSLATTFVVLMAAALCAPFFLATHRGGTPGWSVTEVRPGAPSRAQPRP